MLTRLKVSGFKNLVDVDVRLGPFTCVVGPNGVGKSNLFDAIRFLSGLAQGTLMEAAAAVRDHDSRTPDARNLFHRAGDRYVERMSFEAEMLVPRKAVDDLGQEATASITFLRYCLALRHRETGDTLAPGTLEIVEEELVHISQRDALRHLLFPHSVKHWRESAVQGRRTNAPFISTHVEGGDRIICLHQDGGTGGPSPERRPICLGLSFLSPTPPKVPLCWWHAVKWKHGACCDLSPRRSGGQTYFLPPRAWQRTVAICRPPCTAWLVMQPSGTGRILRTTAQWQAHTAALPDNWSDWRTMRKRFTSTGTRSGNC